MASNRNAGGVPAITWVNHASFVAEYDGVRLICDPWLDGTAFKDGWALISPTRFGPGDFAGITHIWISHQHPDHFAPANLKQIPADVRHRITVLYQTTADKLVVSWLRTAGFGDVVELPPGEWCDLTSAFSVKCDSIEDDSWLAIRTPGATLLNLNDCVVKETPELEHIAKQTGDVDVLFTQFSYANWVGNPPDIDARRREAREKLERIRRQADVLKPAAIVPFASFVYFCHEENFYHNDAVNTVQTAAEFIERELHVSPIVLYPGDSWMPGATPHWAENAARYEADRLARLAAGPTHFRRTLSYDQLAVPAEQFLGRLRKKNPRARFFLRGTTEVFFTDWGRAYALSIRGLRPSNADERGADIATSSENVLYAFRTPWGADTLAVSGRFTSWRGDARLRFFRFIRYAQHLNTHPVDLAWMMTQFKRVWVKGANRLRALAPASTGRKDP